MKTMKQLFTVVAIVAMLTLTLMLMTGKFNPLSSKIKAEVGLVTVSEAADTNQLVPANEESADTDPAKEARDLQLSEMGFDPKAGHGVSVTYTSSVSQNK